MKKLIPLFLIFAAGAAGLPLVNLYLDLQAKDTLPAPEIDSPKFAAARAVFEKKCLNCHSNMTRMPIYAAIPGAKAVIQKDIQAGREALLFEDSLYPGGVKPVSEPTLCKIEYALDSGAMPPIRYSAMHWISFMTPQDKAAVKAWIREVREKNYMTPGVCEEFKYHAIQPLPDKIPLDEKKVALGKKLFHDVRLSSDNTLSCSSCHSLDKGGTDQSPVSKGIRGQMGPINSPTVYNSGFQFMQFWDGRAKDLEEQAAGPVHNPLEMGSNWDEVLPKLNQDAALTAEFAAIYPDGISGKNITNAIAEFEKSLITPNSRFDKYLKGDKTALNADEFEGFRLFQQKSCVTCHSGKLLGGQSFEKMGAVRDYFKTRGGELREADRGRFNATKNPADQSKFKVPTLRNIELTAPYFHDASAADLKQAVMTMAKHQVEAPVSEAEAEKIVLFLKTLTGEYEGKALK